MKTKNINKAIAAAIVIKQIIDRVPEILIATEQLIDRNQETVKTVRRLATKLKGLKP